VNHRWLSRFSLAARVLMGYKVGDGRLREFLGLGKESASGETVDRDSCLGLAAYFACIRVISEDVAKLPFQTYLYGDNREKAYDHPSNRILDIESSYDVGAMSFRESMTADAASVGNAFAEISRNGRGQAVELFHLNPWCVVAKLDEKGRLYYTVTSSNGRTEDFDPYDIFHLKGLGKNPYVGISVVECGQESFGLGLAQQKYGSAFYGNSAAPNAAIELPESLGDVDPESLKTLRKDWEDRYKGAGKAGTIGFMLPGWKLQTYSISPKDAEALTTRQFTVEEVCRWFRIAPHKIQHLLRSTNNNIEHQGLEHVTDTLQPWFKRWEQEANRKLFTTEEKSRYYTKHNADALLRGDTAARSTFYREMFNIGAININEIRGKEDLPSIGTDGDKHFVPMNLIPIDKVDEFATAKAGNGMTEEPIDNPPGKNNAGKALQAVLAQDLERMIRKESAAAKAKMTKPKEFPAWLAEFFEKHNATVRDAVKVACRGWVLVSDCEQGAGELAEAIAEQHCLRSRNDLDAALDKPASEFAAAVESIVDGWTNRAADEAAEFFGVNDESRIAKLA